MELNDLLRRQNIDPSVVLALRHRPNEPDLNRAFELIAGERPDLFNAYQHIQTRKVEKAMQALSGRRYLASFIRGDWPEAVFIGLHAIVEFKPLTREEFWRVPEHQELKTLGMRGFSDDDPR
jgi:hypothetical protein